MRGMEYFRPHCAYFKVAFLRKSNVRFNFNQSFETRADSNQAGFPRSPLPESPKHPVPTSLGLTAFRLSRLIA
jgi:hypothetical protein